MEIQSQMIYWKITSNLEIKMKLNILTSMLFIGSIISISITASNAMIVESTKTEIDGKTITFIPIPLTIACSPLDTEEGPVYMRKGTGANNKLRKIWKKVKFNQNKSIEQYTFSCDKARLEKDIYTINFVSNSKDYSRLTVIYAPEYQNAYGIFQTAQCEFIADSFSDKPDPVLKAILQKYLLFMTKEECL